MNLSQHVFFDLGIKALDSYYTMSGLPLSLPSVLMDKVGTDMSGYRDSINISLYFFPSYSVGNQFYSQRRFYSRNVATDDGLGQGAYLSPDSGVQTPVFFDVSLSSPNLTHLFTVLSPLYGYFTRCIFWYQKPSSSSAFKCISLSQNKNVIID